MDYSKESLDRIKKIEDLKKAGVICYANNFVGKIDIKEIRKKSGEVREVENLMESGAKGEFKTAGRLISSRGMGKLLFGKLRDHSGDIQVCFMRDKVVFNTGQPALGKEKNHNLVQEIEVGGELKSAYKIAEKFISVGDYVGITGDLFLTKHGELTLFVKEFQILSKAIRPLPEKFHGIVDQESIYRQRYLDLIMNQDSYDRFLFRSKFVKVLRDFYEENNFIEIETPTLGNSASGAAAKPFISHHNDFNQEYFLKISDETSLKKATVGRFERVFEIDKNFRNEGSDPSHLQEFTMVEHYATFWNFEDNMKFTEVMFEYLFKKLNLDNKVSIKDKNGNERIIDFSSPWEKIDYVEGVNKASGLDITSYNTGDEDKLIADIKSKNIEFEGMNDMGVPTLIDYLYKKVLRPSILGPAFIYNYPKIMQPLARASDENPSIVEQWQLLINGWEVIKAYSELVDPKVQKENFDSQKSALEKGDEEATSGDDDFVLAMEYGMPPQSGFGMGIDRLVSLLTGQDNLRDVVLFPLMKEVKDEKKDGTKLAVAILNKAASMEKWQELNTVSHLSSAFAAREGKNLFFQDEIKTKDGKNIKLNIQHAIVIKQADSYSNILDLIKKSKQSGLQVSEFTREMLEFSDDKKVIESTGNKDLEEIEHLGVLIFGDKKDVEKLSKGFDLYK